jgi:hypothetical protein
MIPKRLAAELDPGVEAGFPPARSYACCSHRSFSASAGEARSEKIMLKQHAKAKDQIK